MSEDKTQDSPSADDIVDDLAEEMGVDDSSDGGDEHDTTDTEQAPTEDADTGGDEDEQQAESQQDPDDDDSVDQDDSSPEQPEDAEQPDPTPGGGPEPAADTDYPRGTDGHVGELAGVDDLLDPDDTDHVDVNASVDPSEFSALDDLNDSIINKKVVAIALAVCAGILAALHPLTLEERGGEEVSVYDDLALLFQGQFQAEMLRQVENLEREYVEEQEKIIPEFGHLTITGSPPHSLIRMDGDVLYAKPEGADYVRELRIPPNDDIAIENLPMSEDHHIEIEHPGHETYEITITEDMWRNYRFHLRANLTPESPEAHREFHSRMLDEDHVGEPDGDADNGDEDEDHFDYYGTVVFNTSPGGAHIVVNSLVARDEDGDPLETPVEVDEYYTYDVDVGELYEERLLEDIVTDQERLDQIVADIERRVEEAEQRIEEAEDDDETDPDDIEEVDKIEELSRVAIGSELEVDEDRIERLDDDYVELRERQFQVNRDIGDSDAIMVVFPDDHHEVDDLVNYATNLERAMWECQFLDDEELEELDEDAPLVDHCEYVYEFDLDFYGIVDFLEERDQQKERIEEAEEQFLADVEALDEEFDERLQAFGHSIEDVERVQPAAAEDDGEAVEDVEDVDEE